MTVLAFLLKAVFNMFYSFLAALSFYTRLPIGAGRIYSDDEFRRALVFLPVTGAIIGGIGALVWYGSSFLFSNRTSLIFSLSVTILLTGAFHEDGLADTCDGLGGGWKREDKLKIMKDSRVGSYGMLGMILAVLLKLSLLEEINSSSMVAVMIGCHMLSRLVPLSLVKVMKYARSDDSSAKLGGVSEGLKVWEWLAGHILAFVLLFILCSEMILLVLLLPISVLFFYLFYKKQIGGYTGDLLGASQQISELLFLAASVVLCRFIV